MVHCHQHDIDSDLDMAQHALRKVCSFTRELALPSAAVVLAKANFNAVWLRSLQKVDWNSRHIGTAQHQIQQGSFEAYRKLQREGKQ